MGEHHWSDPSDVDVEMGDRGRGSQDRTPPSVVFSPLPKPADLKGYERGQRSERKGHQRGVVLASESLVNDPAGGHRQDHYVAGDRQEAIIVRLMRSGKDDLIHRCDLEAALFVL